MIRNNKIISSFFDLIFPIKCLSCNREGQWLCPDCWSKLGWQPHQKCLHCNNLNSWGEFCEDCQPYYFLDGLLVAGYYDGLLKEVVKTCKYQFAEPVGTVLGNLLILFLQRVLSSPSVTTAKFLPWAKNLVVPVPLAKRRYHWRGFNQAAVIARQFGDYFNLELADRLERQPRPAQARLSRQERKQNLTDSFHWLGRDLSGQNIILIDDVATTGSTLNECAKALKRAGAKQVWGLVVAK